MNLNKATSHGIRLLVACARSEGGLVKVAELADELDLTTQNVFKIVHLLSRAGFIKAIRGRNGGVSLALPAVQIRVGDVVRKMEYPAQQLQENEAPTTASDDELRLVEEAFEAFIGVLNQTTIADMASSAGSGKKPRPARKTAGMPRGKIAKSGMVGRGSATRRS